MTSVGGVPGRTGACLDLLRAGVEGTADAPGAAWFRQTLDAVAEAGTGPALIRAIGLAPRKLGKADLGLTAEDRAVADRARPGFDPTGLSIDQAARIAFVLASYRDDVSFAETLEFLCRTADLGELVAYYRGLAVFPAPERLHARAAEGVRSAIKPVFEAVAHRNPYPREQFDGDAWNQMVLKALFIGSSLADIQGLDARANPNLAHMLVDYAHERWSAGRPVDPELWRCVGPFADDRALDDLGRLVRTGAPAEQRAAALALHACARPQAHDLLARHPLLATAAATGELSWDGVGEPTRPEP